MATTEHTQPTVTELLARIEALEGRHNRREGRFRRLRARGALIAAVVFATLAVTTSTFASIPDTSGIIHGCYSAIGGEHAVFLIDTAKTAACSTGQTPVSFYGAGAPIPGASVTGNIPGKAAGFTGNLGGDVTGGQTTTRVTGINGSPLGTTTGASSGQVLKWNGSAWAPGADNTGLTAVSTDGSTLTGTGTAGSPLGVDTSAIQQRVTGNCTTGSSINAVNNDGTVTCQTPPRVLCPGCYLPNANLNDANLVGAQLTPDRLGNPTNLRGATLDNSNLTNANLSSADLTGATLFGANLAYATLDGATLADVTLTGANLTNAKLLSADLDNASLSSANLSSANLSSANLNSANLSGADLTSANLTGALNGTSTDVSGVIWSDTTCPDGTNSDNDGNTCVGHGF